MDRLKLDDAERKLQAGKLLVVFPPLGEWCPRDLPDITKGSDKNPCVEGLPAGDHQRVPWSHIPTACLHCAHWSPDQGGSHSSGGTRSTRRSHVERLQVPERKAERPMLVPGLPSSWTSALAEDGCGQAVVCMQSGVAGGPMGHLGDADIHCVPPDSCSPQSH